MCILVVEDDYLIRMILVEELQDAGYRVREASTGDEGVAAVQELDGELSLLVTDVHMPGQHSGLDLAAYVRAQWPQAPIIITTGRPDGLAGSKGFGVNQRLVRKPYIPSDIIRHIEAMLRP